MTDDFDMASFDDNEMAAIDEQDSLFADNNATNIPQPSAYYEQDLYSYDDPCYIDSTSTECLQSRGWARAVAGIGLLLLLLLLLIFALAWRKRHLHRVADEKNEIQAATCPHAALFAAQLELARQITLKDLENQTPPKNAATAAASQSPKAVNEPPTYSALYPGAGKAVDLEKQEVEEKVDIVEDEDHQTVTDGVVHQNGQAI